MKRRYILISLICLICPLAGMAQEPDTSRPRQPREVVEPEVRARQMADEMQVKLELDQKQYKKIYKLFLREEKERSQTRPDPGRQGPPPGGRREGGPPPDRNREFSADRPQTRRGIDPEQMQKAIEEKNKKIKKILTDEQYEKWSSLEKEKERKKLPWELKEGE
ncbi:MAG: DUF4890 domain-containing protein [Bacteroides sp.]|nr:DUF4890 domain-containing protein [Bacteroides sp.]